MADAKPWEDVISSLDKTLSAPYTQPLPKIKHPALLLIDFYNSVFGDKPETLPKALKRFPRSCGLAGWQALPSAKKLLSVARKQNLPVIYTKDKYPVQKGIWPTKRKLTKQPSAWDAEIIKPLAPKKGEIVISKEWASGFFGTPLASYLVKLGIDGLIVAGETTSGCVRATIVDAYSYGFPVLLVEEATFDRFLLSHKINLFDINCKYGWVVKEKAAIDVLEKTSY